VFRNLNYELFITNMDEAKKDSILQFNKFKTIILVDVNGEETRLDMYRKLDPDALYLDDILEGGTHEDDLPYNRDNFYGILNGKTENLLQCQYFHFDRANQPLSYFLKNQ